VIIAIDSKNEDLAGAIVYWRLSGEVNGDFLNTALQASGLDDADLVNLPTPRRALRRALLDLCGPDTFMRTGKFGDGGFYLVRQLSGEGDGPSFEIGLRATLPTTGVPKFEADEEHGAQWDTAAILKNYWHHIDHVDTTDVSSWLIKQMSRCDGIAMRDTGGVYFIPRHQIDEWRRRADALHAHTACKVYMVPAMNSEEALDAILQALIDECDSFTNALQEAIVADELGPRALESKSAAAKDMLEKLSRYEELLGSVASKKLAPIREQIEMQQMNAVQTALLKEAAQ